jgi:hypothetical protein
MDLEGSVRSGPLVDANTSLLNTQATKTINVTKALGPAAALNPLVQARSPGPIYSPIFSADSRFPALPTVLFSAAPRNAKDPDAAAPGPGAFGAPFPPDATTQRKVSIRGREKFGSINPPTSSGIGPGEYPRQETVMTRKRNPPKYSLKGRSTANTRPAFEAPAPNAHQHPEPFNKKQFIAKLHNAPAVRLGPPPKQRSRSAAAVLGGTSAGAGSDTTRAETAATAHKPGTAPNNNGGDDDEKEGKKEGKEGEGKEGGAGATKGPKKPLISADIAAMARSSPAPTDYSPSFNFVSTLPRTPAFSMVPRRAQYKPGGHVCPEFHDCVPGIGKQPLAGKKTAPSVSFSGRSKFGSPYFL